MGLFVCVELILLPTEFILSSCASSDGEFVKLMGRDLSSSVVDFSGFILSFTRFAGEDAVERRSVEFETCA